MKYLLTIVIFLTALNTQAAFYKYTDENGEVVYSDQPPYVNAKEFIPPKLQVTPAVKPKIKPEVKPAAEKIIEYTAFNITSPTNGKTLRSNAGNVKITLAINPKLNTKAGHYINILINGVPITKNSTLLSTTLNNIDRGTHTLLAELREKSGKLIMFSNNVIIHVQRFSKLHKKNTP